MAVGFIGGENYRPPKSNDKNLITYCYIEYEGNSGSQS